VLGGSLLVVQLLMKRGEDLDTPSGSPVFFSFTRDHFQRSFVTCVVDWRAGARGNHQEFAKAESISWYFIRNFFRI
jgi:hypothetical protein